MRKGYSVIGGLLAVSFGAGFFVGHSVPMKAQVKARVFEIRTATLSGPAGRDKLIARFRSSEARLFEKSGMTAIGFFVPSDPPRSDNTVFYILGHESRERAKESWDRFRADPESKQIVPTGAELGPVKVDDMYVEPLEFSAMK